MNPIWAVVVAGVVVGGRLAIGVYDVVSAARRERLREQQREAGRAEVAREAARALGLELAADAGFEVAARVMGRIGHVDVDVKVAEGASTSTHFEARGAAEELYVSSGSHSSRLMKLIAGEDIATGDAEFDKVFRVRDLSKAHALGILNRPARHVLQYTLPRAPLVNRGSVSFSSAREPVAKGIIAAVRDAVQLVEALREPENVGRALEQSVLNDPEPTVRLNCLKALEREGPEVLAHEAAWRAQRDTDARVRVAAASITGSEAVPVLLDVIADAALEDSLRIEALQIVERRWPESLKGLLPKLLDGSPGDLRMEAIAACGRLLDVAAVPGLERLAASQDSDDRVLVAQALGRLQIPSTEPTLIALLEDPSGAAVRIHAAMALGLFGTAHAVQPLHEAPGKFTYDHEFVNATRQAIAGIQSRIAGAEAGQVSLATAPSGGELSVSDPTQGNVSLVAPEKLPPK